MARIVLGIGTSHTPMLNAAVDDWPERGKRLRDWVRPADLPGRLHHAGLRDLLRSALGRPGGEAA
mgnify:CR=1 FL=1